MSSQDAMTAIASIPREDDEPVFAEPWEARAFAMVVALQEAGLFDWSDWAERFGAALKVNSDLGGCLSYYQVWLRTLEAFMADSGLADPTAIARRAEEWGAAAARTPHGQPIEL